MINSIQQKGEKAHENSQSEMYVPIYRYLGLQSWQGCEAKKKKKTVKIYNAKEGFEIVCLVISFSFWRVLPHLRTSNVFYPLFSRHALF